MLKQKTFKLTSIHIAIIIIFFILLIITINALSTNSESTQSKETTMLTQMLGESKQKNTEIKQKKDKLKSSNIGKMFCNKANDVCSGEIIDIRPCTVNASQQCYVIDIGEDYSRPAEHPISSGYAKEDQPNLINNDSKTRKLNYKNYL